MRFVKLVCKGKSQLNNSAKLRGQLLTKMQVKTSSDKQKRKVEALYFEQLNSRIYLSQYTQPRANCRDSAHQKYIKK